MAIKPSKIANRTIKKALAPNKRERASAQFGQLDQQTAADWNLSTLPKSIQEAIAQLAARVKALEP